MKVSFEMPLQLLKNGVEKRYNDYGYALVHLFEQDKEYLDYYVETLKKGREIILDNSVFELEEAFDPNRFAYWINYLYKESGSDNFYYVIPDVLDDSIKTMVSFGSFVDAYPDLPGKRMAVLQGDSFKEMSDCLFFFLNKGVDKVGISFNCNAYNNTGKSLIDWKEGRQEFISYLIREFPVTFLSTKFHLLGASLPDEFIAYKDMENIVSLDTSNPVVHGIKGFRYVKGIGLDFKLSIKLVDLLHAELNEKQLKDIKYNIKEFKGINSI